MTERQYYLDWIRFIAVLLLVPFHSALIFSLNPGDVVYIKAAAESAVLIQFAYFLNAWHMPLLFFVSGASAWYALQRRSAGQFIKERFFRLIIPTVFASIILIPPMTYVHHMESGRFASFFHFYIQFFRIDFSDLAGLSGSWTPAHTWFLIYLFVLSLILLPLFKLLQREGVRGGLEKIMRFCSRYPVMLLLFVPIAAARLLPAPEGEKGPVFFLLWILFGFLYSSSAGFQEKVFRFRRLNLGLAALSYTAVVLLYDIFGLPQRMPAMEAVGYILFIFSRWLWVLTLVGLGRACLQKSGKVYRYLAASAYPVYMLHHLVNTWTAKLILLLKWPIMVQYPLIVIITFVLIFLVYEGIVTRFKPLRFLLGMKSP